MNDVKLPSSPPSSPVSPQQSLFCLMLLKFARFFSQFFRCLATPSVLLPEESDVDACKAPLQAFSWDLSRRCSRLLVFGAAIATLVLHPAQLRAQEITDEPNPPLPTLTAHWGKAVVTLEIANNQEERERGLMYRQHLEDNWGMIFVMPSIARAHFWMKNTVLPLSVAFLDSKGRILEVADMQPEDLETTASKSDQVAYVVEMNQHWFDLNRVKEGDLLDISPKSWAQLVSP